MDIHIDLSSNETESQAFIARQPIVKQSGIVFGYEMFFRGSAGTQVASIENELNASANLMFNIMSEMGLNSLFNEKIGFINVSKDTILSGLIEVLPHLNVVLEIDPQIEVTEEVIEKCQSLFALGYKFALNIDHAISAGQPLVAFCSHIKGDIKHFDQAHVKSIISQFRADGLICVAERVETQEQFDVCKEVGFNLFQGYFFAKPENISIRTISTSCAVVIEMMGLVGGNAEIKQLSDCLKKDLSLSFKLLKYISSAGFGASCAVSSIRHAIAILGHAQLYRWLTLLLATSTSGSSLAEATRNAMGRGKLCELLGASFFTEEENDNLFYVGTFSLLEDLLGSPLENALSNVMIPDLVSDAILLEEGVFSPFLKLAIACEEKDIEQINSLSDYLTLDPVAVMRFHTQSFVLNEI